MPNSFGVESLSRRLKAGEALLAGWSSIADPAVAELMVRAGFDTAVIDMQHGAHRLDTAFAAIAAVALAGAPAIVRIPVGDNASVSRLLDHGAAAIIAPMINSVADAQAFADAVKYPPLGQRSWGPHRAVALTGLAPADYLAGANDLHLALPMIETRAALEALDDILGLPGIDGVFVGPSDLSIALTGGRLDPRGAEVDRALDRIAARARAAGKIAGLFCFDAENAKAMAARGFGLCSIASDALLLGAGVRAAVAAAR
jgi:4-hydroxy-2-oxoheptanedioate aldolase